MWYVLIFLILATLAVGCSVPIAYASNIAISDIFFSFLAFMTFCGIMSGAILIITRPLTKVFFKPEDSMFNVPKWELKFYEKIKLKKWKKIVPDWGKLTGFKKEINYSEAKNHEYYARFLYENLNASILHSMTIFISPVYFLFLNPKFHATIGLFGLLIIIILNIIPVMIQRMLRPRLLKLYYRKN